LAPWLRTSIQIPESGFGVVVADAAGAAEAANPPMINAHLPTQDHSIILVMMTPQQENKI
jgi:hypothetical protein